VVVDSVFCPCGFSVVGFRVRFGKLYKKKERDPSASTFDLDGYGRPSAGRYAYSWTR